MGNELDVIGERYGRLVVIKEVDKRGRNRMVECLCDCGRNTITYAGNLKNGHCKSCGCYHKEAPLKGFNEIIIHKDCAEMILESKKFGICSTFFDLKHIDNVRKYTRWYLNSNKYAQTMLTDRTVISMHIMLCETDKPIVDHKDRDTLNNRDNNLRGATVQENCRNRTIGVNNKSGCVGVHKYGDGWRARIGVGKKNISLGLFKNLEDAIKERRVAEIKYFGDFAPIGNVASG